jgi:uncharacterized protein HemX
VNPQQQPNPTPGTNLIEAELQHNIPVKPHTADEKNPIMAVKQFVEHDNKNDDGLDEVLKDVNNSVKDSENKSNKKSFLSFMHKKQKVQVPQAVQQPAAMVPAPVKTDKPKTQKNLMPMIVIGVAAIVAIGLAVVAFYAFKQQKKTAVNTSANTSSAPTTSTIQNVSTGQLTATDIKDFSTNIQSNFASLSDAKDFNQDDLSDASLGL